MILHLLQQTTLLQHQRMVCIQFDLYLLFIQIKYMLLLYIQTLFLHCIKTRQMIHHVEIFTKIDPTPAPTDDPTPAPTDGMCFIMLTKILIFYNMINTLETNLF